MATGRTTYYSGYDDYHYTKGSRIAVDNAGTYYIITHHRRYENWGFGVENNYYVLVKTNSAEGGSSGTYRYDREDIHDISFDGERVIAFYKAGNVVTTAQVTVSGISISLTDTQTVTTALANNSTNPGVLTTISGNRTLGGISSGKPFTSYNNAEKVFDEHSVKSNTVVVVPFMGGSYYAIYTDTGGVIRIIKNPFT